MEYQIRENWSSGSGNILVSKTPTKLNVGDQYIGDGLSGRNIFTWDESQKKQNPTRKGIKIIARSKDFKWSFSGSGRTYKLPVVDI